MIACDGASGRMIPGGGAEAGTGFHAFSTALLHTRGPEKSGSGGALHAGHRLAGSIPTCLRGVRRSGRPNRQTASIRNRAPQALPHCALSPSKRSRLNTRQCGACPQPAPHITGRPDLGPPGIGAAVWCKGRETDVVRPLEYGSTGPCSAPGIDQDGQLADRTQKDVWGRSRAPAQPVQGLAQTADQARPDAAYP